MSNNPHFQPSEKSKPPRLIMSNTMNKIKMVKLGSLCEQLRGVSYKKSDATDTEADGYIPILRANNIDDGLINFDSLVYIPKAIVKDRQIIKEGDVVIAASSGSISVVGKGAQATESLDVSFGAFCKLLRPNPKVNPRFFGHFFQSKSYRQIISRLAAGANINNLKNEHLNDLDFPDIPLPEQKRIAEILDLADEARRKRRENLKLYDDLIRSLFLQTFGDPVSNPKGWDQVNLGDFLSDIIGGKSVGGEVRPLVPGEYGVIKISAVTSGEFRPDEYKAVSKKELPLELIHPLKGDLLFSRANTREMVGATCVVRDDYRQLFLPDKIWKLKAATEELSVPYLKYLLSHEGFRNGLRKVASGTNGSMLNISKAKLRALEIPLPPIELQREFSEQAKEINAQKAREQALVEQHDDLFNSLLQRAFKGELAQCYSAPDREIVEKGAAVLNMLALLYSAPDASLGRFDVELGLILMRFDDLRQRILAKGALLVGAGNKASRPRVKNMDDFLADFDGIQFSAINIENYQTISLGPKAMSLRKIQGMPKGREILKRASEALVAAGRINEACRKKEDVWEVLGANDVTAFAIQG